MVCLPATQFGCGFSVTCGVKFILLLNLAMNVAIIITSLLFLVWDMPSFVFTNGYGNTMIMLAFALAGVPVIVVAFHGVIYKNEPMVRMYLYYMWISIVVYLCMEFHALVLEDPCVTIQRFMPNGTSAWACGMARYIDIFLVVTSISIMAYFQYVVSSHCEDLAVSGGGPELKDLVLNKGHYYGERGVESVYMAAESMLMASGHLEDGLSKALGANLNVNAGFYKGDPIFGSYHSMEYPPIHGIRHC